MKILQVALQCLLLSPVGTGDGAAPFLDARESSAAIEQKFVADTSAKGYVDQLIRFIVHLFDNDKTYLDNFHLQQMENLHNADIRNFETASRRTRRNRNTTPNQANPRTQLRQYIKSSIENIQPARDGTHHNCPVKIDGPGAIDYGVVSSYMATKVNIVIVDRESALSYMKAIGKTNPTIEPEMEAPDGKVRLQIYQGRSTVSAVRSAISYMYKRARVTQSAKMQKEMSLFVNGMKRSEAAAKQHLGLKITEGKAPLILEAYEFLARKLFYSGDKRDVFAHLFFVLDWCLMKRAENVTEAKINHIRWWNNCLVLYLSLRNRKETRLVSLLDPGMCMQIPGSPGFALSCRSHDTCSVIQKF